MRNYFWAERTDTTYIINFELYKSETWSAKHGKLYEIWHPVWVDVFLMRYEGWFQVKIYEIWALNEENSNGMKYDASPHQQHFLSHLIKVAAALWTLSSVVSTKHSRKESLFGLLKDLMLSSATKLMTSSVFYSTMEVFVILYCSTYVIRCSKYKVRE